MDTDGFSEIRTAGGQTFVVRDVGTGPLVAFIHGFPDTPHTWTTIVEPVAAAGYRCVTPWLRGYHPATVVAGRGYGSVAVAEDAIALLDALDATDAVLVGHDWGASAVYGAASLAPERVRAIVPIAIPHPSFLKPSLSTAWGARHFLSLRLPGAERTVARNDFAYLDTLYSRWAPSWSGTERTECLTHVKKCFANPASVTGALAYYRAFSPRTIPELAAVPNVRGLVVGGPQDLFDAALIDRTAAALAPGSQALVLPGSGHWPHREREAAFTDALITFLASLA